MAEASDRPAPEGPALPAATEAVQPTADIGAGGPILAGEAPESYRPLSLLALVGFVLALLYAVVVGVGAVASLFARGPWLLPAWLFLAPLAAFVLSWVARSSIRASENTRSGLALTTWGLGLSAAVGLSYGAYYTATFLAVRQQARAFADNWLRDLRKGDLEKAFWMTTAPAERPSEREMTRQNLEIQHNSPADAPGAPAGAAVLRGGPYSAFGQFDYVRLLALAGDAAGVEFIGVRDWTFERGGYRVALDYQVTTPLARFPLIVTVHGSDGPRREGGRQWWVVLGMTGRSSEETGPALPLTEEGLSLVNLTGEAQQTADAWVKELLAGDSESALLVTRPGEERAGLQAARQRALLAGLVTGAAPLPEPAAYAAALERRQFLLGGLVRAEEGVFWADLAQRAEVLRAVQRLFDPLGGGDRPAPVLSLPPTSVPLVKRSGDRVEVRYDVRMVLPRDDLAAPPFIVEAYLVLTADLIPESDRLKGPWRVTALELQRGRSAPVRRAGP
jgi:hypothetical protein